MGCDSWESHSREGRRKKARDQKQGAVEARRVGSCVARKGVRDARVGWVLRPRALGLSPQGSLMGD